MKLALGIGFIAAGLVAADCNVKYNVKPEPQCIADCNRKAGQSMWSGWTDDVSSPNFIKSLSYMCARGTPNYMTFMTKGGICMENCSKDDQQAFVDAFGQICGFYDAFTKNPDCKDSAAVSSASSSGGTGKTGPTASSSTGGAAKSTPSSASSSPSSANTSTEGSAGTGSSGAPSSTEGRFTESPPSGGASTSESVVPSSTGSVSGVSGDESSAQNGGSSVRAGIYGMLIALAVAGLFL